MPDNRTYRIKANIQGEDFVNIGLNLNQDINVFELLSLKIDTENLYRLHTANYGCVAGRVLANNAIGVPNVKLSIFIAADENISPDSVLSYLYPYDDVMDKDDNGIRYNLLPEERLTECYQNVGTFPSKRLVLDDNNVFEVFDKYYKFTTTTNSAGDYMIFGVPVGTQILHMDVDLSDIGEWLSQRPRDFIYKGYDVNQFENANTFKKDKNLNTLTQIFSQNESVEVHPFWGEVEEMGEVDSTGVRITRKDINLNYKFEPTCVFMGSLITDEKSNGFTKRCIPTERMGKMDRITTGEGTIEMIRKTPDGKVEEFSIMGNQLIDGNGTWCYQIPMNLDYVRMDEYGNIVPTNDIEKGFPTRAQVRFRFSLNDFASDYQNNHLTKMLVPNNPQALGEMGDTYAFGTKTPDSEFRDLFWNKVYSVKSYIPRVQKSNTNREKRFSGIKAVNVNVGNNPIPYNNMRIDITFMFILQCAIMHTLIWIAGFVNNILSILGKLKSCGVAADLSNAACITVGDGACPDLEGWYFAPKCSNDKTQNSTELHLENIIKLKWGQVVKTKEGVRLLNNTLKKLKEKELDTDITDEKSLNNENLDDDEAICLTNKIDYFVQCIEIALAQEYEVIQFDFYNDWINGLLYIPRWFANIKKKRKYLFGLLGPKKAKIQACMEGHVNYQRRYVQQCALEYEKSGGKYTKVVSKKGCVDRETKQKCHKGKGRKNVKILKYTTPGGGFIHDEQTMKGEYAYYFRPCDWYNGKKKINYFTTDIILLGSLSERDIDGIPQTFKELVSSSYQMPTNIAATNMDTVAYMYGMAGNGGSICSGKGVQDVQKNENTFQDYQKWAKNTEYGNDIDNDPNEYEVTEAAGIDWGYTGPGQNYTIQRSGRNGKTEANYENSFYQPGGHFLGIACFNAESNIKSCVNLSRICELGATMSQRQAIVKRNGNEVTFDEAFLVPTGLISKDEISDGGFRSEFATLNHNGLATRKNPITKRVEYDFISMLPNNFDGALESKTNSTAYNNINGRQEPEGSTYARATAYTRTIEDTSIDYYDFRLGLNGNESAENKYLIINGSRASLPIYNNSFYFYFGLRDGSTALDRFYKEFFAECPSINDGMGVIKITTEPVLGGLCDPSAKGSATIFIGGIDTASENQITYTLRRDGNFVSSGTYPSGASSMKLDGLSSGRYEITFSSDIFEDIKREFIIDSEEPCFISGTTIEINDFTETKYDDDITDTEGRANVKVKWPTEQCPTGEKVCEVWVTNKSGDHKSELTNDGVQYLWADEEYDIIVYYTCDSCDSTAPYTAYTFTPSMPKEFDVLIGGSTKMTFNRKIKGKLPYSNWWESVLSNPDTGIEALEDKFYTEKALTYRGSLYEKGTSTIDVKPAYGRTPYQIEQGGDGERLGDENETSTVLYLSNGQQDGYDLNFGSFLYPTLNEPPTTTGYYTILNSSGGQKSGKNNYSARFTEANGTGTAIPVSDDWLTLPSIYKPFFVRCAIVGDFTTNNLSNRYSLTIVNGLLFDSTFDSIRVCSDEPSNKGYSQNEWWTLNGGDVNDFNVYKTENTLPLTDKVNYSVYVKCSAPSGSNIDPETKNIEETVRFLGDGGVPDTTVRYFLLCRETVNGTRQYEGEKNYLSLLREKLISAITFSDGTHLKEGQENDVIYWGGSCTNAFEINLGDGGYLHFKPSNEINRTKIFAGDVSAISEENRKSDCFVLGVYDPWTQLSDENFAAAQNSTTVPDIKWYYAGKDSDMLAIFRLYTAEGFKNLIANPDMYPDEGHTDDDTQDSFVVYTAHFYKEIEASYDANLNVETAIESGTEVLAAFDIKSVEMMITIPSLTIRVNGPLNASMVTKLGIRIANTKDEENYKYLDILNAAGIYDEGYNVSGYEILRTVADDILASEFGDGRYVMTVEYELKIDGLYGQILYGHVEIDSDTIQVTTR